MLPEPRRGGSATKRLFSVRLHGPQHTNGLHRGDKETQHLLHHENNGVRPGRKTKCAPMSKGDLSEVNCSLTWIICAFWWGTRHQSSNCLPSHLLLAKAVKWHWRCFSHAHKKDCWMVSGKGEERIKALNKPLSFVVGEKKKKSNCIPKCENSFT